MNRGWRIRHKLLLGVALFVAMLVFLIGGTLQGLWSYYQTTLAVKANVLELRYADMLRSSISPLLSCVANTPEPDHEAIRDQLRQSRVNLGLLGVAAQDNTPFHLTPSDTSYTTQMVGVLEADLNGIALAQDAKTTVDQKRANLAKAVDRLDRDSTDLREKLYDDLDYRLASTRRHYQKSLWIIIPASLFGLLLTIELLRFFYGWVIQPVRDLETGVKRIASGDLAHRINLNSGDEMQELASEFNAMMDRLQDVYKDLEKQVNDRSRQLVRSERLASVGFLAAGVSHEINNPLASIAFCAESLEGRLKDPDGFSNSNKATFERYLQMIQNEAFRCKKITDKLLAFSRSGPTTRQPTDIKGIIDAVNEVIDHLPSKQGKSIRFEPPLEPLVVTANPEELKSVVINLAVNALDSMDHGGLLDIQIGQSMNTVILRFTDTGCGMDKESLNNIFEPFFTQKKSGRGTGLGLTICHCIIQDHGGTIEAQSEGLGKGSTFLVRLPLAQGNTQTKPMARPESREILGFPEVNPFRAIEMGASRKAA